MKLILISGHAEVGKTLATNIIKEKLKSKGKRVTILPFASYLKFICKEHFGWNGNKDENGRGILQYVGTDVVRKNNPDFWVKTVADFINAFQENFDFIISDDIRFPNEIDYFRDVAITDFISIRVERLDFENSLTKEQREHASETSLDNYPYFDVYITSLSGKERLEYVIDAELFQDKNFSSWLFN